MTVNYTTLLGLAKPVSGTESGTWGDTVNNNLTDYLDDAIAGAQIISGTLTAVTLSKTTGANLSQAGTGSTGSSQYQIIRCTGAPASLLTITVPAANKTYVVINATSTSQSVKIVGAGPTTGVTIASGKTSIVSWNGSDFVEITPSTISGTLPVANGGTGNTTGTATINANLTGAITSIGNTTSLGSFTSANLAAALTDETGTGANVFASNPTFPAQINLTANSGYNIYASGNAANYFAGAIGIGTTPYATTNMLINSSITGAANANGFLIVSQIKTDVTSTATYIATQSNLITSGSVSVLTHYLASEGVFGAGATTTQQMSFYSGDITKATNNYGFFGAVTSGTGRYNLYMAGSADNYLAGSLGIGSVPYAGVNILATKSIGGATLSSNFTSTATVLSSVTERADVFVSYTGTQAASFTLPNLRHYGVYQAPIGAGSSVTYQLGFYADASLTGATNNYGFFGGIVSGTGRYNLFMVGTADNYLAGSLGVGSATPSARLYVQSADTNALVINGVFRNPNGGSGVSAIGFNVALASEGDYTQAGIGLVRSVTNGSGSLCFYNKGSGTASNFTTADEKMRIDARGNVGIGTTSPNASALLDVQSTTQGVRMPNMTTTQKNAISSPAAGLMVFDTTLSKLCVYTGAAWQTITSV